MTTPTGVKHEDQQAVPFEEGLELFDCEGQLLENVEEDDEDSDDEDQDTVTSKAAATGEQNIIPLAIPALIVSQFV